MTILDKGDMIAVFHRSSKLLSMIGRYLIDDHYEIPENIITYYINSVQAFKDSTFYDYPMLNYLFELYQLLLLFVIRKENNPSNNIYMIKADYYLAIVSIHASFIVDIDHEEQLFYEEEFVNPIYLDAKETISELFKDYMTD